jgi:hypothetical protein
MDTNLALRVVLPQGAFRPESPRERAAKSIRLRLDGEVWTKRYAPAVLDALAWMLTDMQHALHHRHAGVAELLGIPESRLRDYTSGARSMPMTVVVALAFLAQTEPWAAVDRMLAHLHLLHWRRSGAFLQGDVRPVHVNFAQFIGQFADASAVMVRALADNVVEEHEALDLVPRLQRHVEQTITLTNSVIAAVQR